MTADAAFYVFDGRRLVTAGTREEAAQAVREAGPEGRRLLVFDASTGRHADLRGAPADAEARGRGRPKLGVEAREVTLLPRHWEWLAAQPGGASAALRRLVETARADTDGEGAKLAARHAADRFMTAMAGNEPGYEEAGRALYRGDKALFLKQTERWPADIREAARAMAAASFGRRKAAR